jgi:hypothetical protein
MIVRNGFSANGTFGQKQKKSEEVRGADILRGSKPDRGRYCKHEQLGVFEEGQGAQC